MMKKQDSGLGYEITEEGAGPFDAFGLDDFERWLRTGLESYLLEGKGAWAFSPAAGEIARHDHLILGLRATYEDLLAHQRALFRQAVANVLASLEPREKNIPIFENLLTLAGLLPIREVLKVLPARIGSSFFGLTSNRDGESLFSLTLLAITELADKAPGEEVVTCLHDLIGSKHFFDYAYAGYTLVALCTADPTGLVEHMNRLRSPLAAMFAKFETSLDAKRYLAKRVLDAIGLQRIADTLPKLAYNKLTYLSAASDDWLIAAAFGGRPRLLGWRERNGGLVIFRPDKPTVTARVAKRIRPYRGQSPVVVSIEISSRRIDEPTMSETEPKVQEVTENWNGLSFPKCRFTEHSSDGVHP